MGLFLPLVAYTATRKRYGDWQNSPYNNAKTRILCQKRDEILPFYNFVRKRLKYSVTFGAASYNGPMELFEHDLVIKPLLTSEKISNNCTIMITSFYDLLRSRTDIRREHEDLDDDEVNKLLSKEIASAETFLGRFTPFLFVPGFSFSPYHDALRGDAEKLAEAFNEFMDPIIVERVYESYDDALLTQVVQELLYLQDESRKYIFSKLKKTKESLEINRS